MSLPYVCAACRLRSALTRYRAKSVALLSCTSHAQQSRGQRSPQRSAFLEASPKPHNDGSRRSEADGKAPPKPTPVGARRRYSGQTLNPEALLSQLDGCDGQRRATDPRPRPYPGLPAQIPGRVEQPLDQPPAATWSTSRMRVPLDTLRKQADNIVAQVEGRHLLPAWHTLTAWAEQVHQEQTRPLIGNVRLRQASYDLIYTTVRNWQFALPRVSQGERRRRKPSECVSIFVKLGWDTSHIWVTVLWKVVTGIASMRLGPEYRPNRESEKEAIDQLMLLWNACIARQLRPQASAASPPHAQSRTTVGFGLDWSFLPSAQMFAEHKKNFQPTFNDMISMLVPSGHAQTSPVKGDYASVAMLTYDLLAPYASDFPQKAQNPAAEQRQTDYSSYPAYSPFLKLIEQCLKIAPYPAVGRALKIKLASDGDPNLAYYEAMVRRLAMSDIPEIRTDREKRNERLSLQMEQATATTQHNSALDTMRLQPPPTDSDGPTDPLREQQSIADSQTGSTSAGAKETKLTQTDPLTASVPGVDTITPHTSEPAFPEVEMDRPILNNGSVDPEVHAFVQMCTKRLGRAIEQQDLTGAERVWDDLGRYASKNSAGSTALPLYMYEQMMLAFLALRRPAAAIEVWNAFARAGFQPTVQTWTVMMRGAQRGRDADASEAFWARMRANGLQPDHHAWSIRLFGLVKARRIGQALRALNEMGSEWIDAVRVLQAKKGANGKNKARVDTPLDISSLGDIEGVPKPSVVIMNSAVSGLATTADEHIHHALAWGRKFGIDPDLITYNVLLNVSMRRGQAAEAFNILKRMQEKGLKPNSTTFTVLLTALFKSEFLDNLSKHEQTEKIMSVIGSIEASTSDARLDEKGYALALDRMLKIHDNAHAAAAVLKHMVARGIKPTPHIYTILMTAYFNAQPPDIVAAEGLWSQMQSSNSGYGATVDVIFYDRMVEAYARHHGQVGIAPMMLFLQRMSKEGKRPSWSALELAARALAERSEWTRLAQLVDDVRNIRGMVSTGARGLTGQNEFWRFIISTGLLEQEGITSPQQVRINLGESSFYGVNAAQTAGNTA